MPTRPTTRTAIFAAIERDGPMTTVDLARAIDKPRGTVNSAINCAREKPGRLRIVGWNRRLVTSGRPAPIYCTSPGKDAPPPPPLTMQQTGKRYRDRFQALIRQRKRLKQGNRSAAPAWLGGLR